MQSTRKNGWLVLDLGFFPIGSISHPLLTERLVVVQLLSCVQAFVIQWIAACQASLSFTISQNLLKLMSVESVMQFNHLIFCCPLLFLSSVFPSIRVFSNDLAFHIRWPKYWSSGFSIGPSNEYSGFSVHKNHFI